MNVGNLEHGSILPRIQGRVAYVAQSAFILNATLRDNVVFGQVNDDERFERAIAVRCMVCVCGGGVVGVGHASTPCAAAVFAGTGWGGMYVGCVSVAPLVTHCAVW